MRTNNWRLNFQQNLFVYVVVIRGYGEFRQSLTQIRQKIAMNPSTHMIHVPENKYGIDKKR